MVNPPSGKSGRRVVIAGIAPEGGGVAPEIELSIVKLPRDLKPHHLNGRAVVVLDVLRATTTIVAAIASGADEVRIFDSIEAARSAAAQFEGPKLLAGEQKCLPPPGFDLGNSPGDFTPERVAGNKIFLTTTNGTRAIVAAHGASRIFVAGVVNAWATGTMLVRLGMGVTLLCSGTDGNVAHEDMIGAGMIMNAIQCGLASRPQWMQSTAQDVAVELRKTEGARNIIQAGLERDIEFASRMDEFDTLVEVHGQPPIARKMQQ